MTPPVPRGRPVGVVISEHDPTVQIKERARTFRQFANDAAQLLIDMLPQHQLQISKTRDSLIEFICCGTDRQIEDMEKAMAEARHYGGEIFKQPDMHEELAKLVEQRDSLDTAIEQARSAGVQLPVPGMAGMLESTVIRPMVKEREFVEQQISGLQKRIEEQ
jgi:hypothetical protein